MTFQALRERNHRRAAPPRRSGWRSVALWMVAAALAGGVAGGFSPVVEAAGGSVPGGPAPGAPRVAGAPSAQQPAADRTAEPQRMFRRYCVGCHNDRLRTADLSIAALDLENVPADAETWEKVVTRLRAGSMPPPGRPRPDEATYRHVAAWLESELDGAWAAAPTRGGSTPSTASTARSTGTPSATCSRSTSMSSRCCRATRPPTAASTTLRMSSGCRPRTSSAICPLRGR